MSDFEELDYLFKGLVEENLDEEQQARLEEIIKEDPAARERYLDYMDVESMLSTHKIKIAHSQPKIKPARRKSTRTARKVPVKRKSRGILLAAAAVLMLTGGAFLYLNLFKQSNNFGTVVSITGKAEVITKAKTAAADKEMKIAYDSEIICPAGINSMLIRSEDGSNYNGKHGRGTQQSGGHSGDTR